MGGTTMSDYKFDGTKLSQRGSTIAKVDGNRILDSHGSKAGSIDGTKIMDSHGSKIGSVDGDKICDSHGSKISTLNDVRRTIDGPGGVSLAALWLLFVR
jgi:hypothetical protein